MPWWDSQVEIISEQLEMGNSLGGRREAEEITTGQQWLGISYVQAFYLMLTTAHAQAASLATFYKRGNGGSERLSSLSTTT